MSIAGSSLRFTFGTLGSRITGLLRDAIITGVFGASTALEAFLVANRIPNLFREMLAEGALGSAFTRVYTSVCEDDKARAQVLLCDALRLGAFALLFISLIGIVGAPWLVKSFTFFATDSGRPEQFFSLTINLTRILFPFLGLALLGAIVMGVLHQRSQFFLSAVAPTSLNIGYIVGALVIGPILIKVDAKWFIEFVSDPRIGGLALGVLLGGALHFGVQFFSVWRQLLRHGRWRDL